MTADIYPVEMTVWVGIDFVARLKSIRLRSGRPSVVPSVSIVRGEADSLQE